MRNLRGRWFEDVGLPLDEPTSALAHRLAPHVERVLDWDAAVRLIQDPRTLQAWEEERAVEAALKARGEALLGHEGLHARLSRVVDAGLDLFFRAAERATRPAPPLKPLSTTPSPAQPTRTIIRSCRSTGCSNGAAGFWEKSLERSTSFDVRIS